VVVFVTLLYDAEIVEVLLAVTVTPVTANVPLVAPAAMVMLAGTVAAAVLLLDSVTVMPPEGAGPLSETVPVPVPPPTSVDGLTETEESSVVTPSEADTVCVAVPLVYAALMVELVLAVTGVVLIVKVALVAPAAIVRTPLLTFAPFGIVATEVLLLARLTVTPPAGAAAYSVSVAVDVPPP
jgi:hypothetical protein